VGLVIEPIRARPFRGGLLAGSSDLENLHSDDSGVVAVVVVVRGEDELSLALGHEPLVLAVSAASALLASKTFFASATCLS
jgi:hypothetical protein